MITLSKLKKLFIILVLITFSLNSYSQIIKKRTLDNDSYVGYFSSNYSNYGLMVNLSYIYMNVKISTEFHPNNQHWDYYFSHQFGIILPFFDNFEVLLGYGYSNYARWNDFDYVIPVIEQYNKFNFNSHLTFKIKKVKLVSGFDFSNNSVDFGLLINVK